jgi:aminoglycoside phosphotransferase (APT) family kinase protein
VIWTWSTDELAKLRVFLEQRLLADGEPRVKPIGDGHANLTYLVSTGDAELVIRRPPPGPIPRGANDVLREARLIEALAGTGVPVPEMLAVGQVGDVFEDVPFYAMSYVRGIVFTEQTPTPLATPSQRRQIGYDLIDTLAKLHSVDWRQRGLEDFGRPGGFNTRHLQRMTQLVADEHGLPDARFAGLAGWLEERTPPESGATILHSDYRLGNVMMEAAGPGRVLAVLDWELATLGDPLLDVGYFLASYPQTGEPQTPTEDFGTALLEDGYPSRAELAGRYAAATGRDLSELRWFVVMSLYKLAALFEHSHRRAISGVGDPYYADPTLVLRFLEAAGRNAGLSQTPTAASA